MYKFKKTYTYTHKGTRANLYTSDKMYLNSHCAIMNSKKIIMGVIRSFVDAQHPFKSIHIHRPTYSNVQKHIYFFLKRYLCDVLRAFFRTTIFTIPSHILKEKKMYNTK